MAAPQSAGFDLTALLDAKDSFPDRYLQFLKVPSMRCGLYVLQPGAVDEQTPHAEDEVYFVLGGAGRLRVGGSGAQSYRAEAGDLLFVPAGVEHRFIEIRDELWLLVFFSAAPAEAPLLRR